MADLADAADRLESAARAIAEMGPEIEGLGPWPLASQFGTEPEASWGPPEVLAHVSEMLPYWLGEIERIVAAPAGSGPVPFGRVSGDPIRIAIIGRDRTIPTRELVARIAADGHRVARRLRELEASVVAREGGPAGEDAPTGLHPRLGEMTLPDIGERFLATHAAEHVLQLQEILAAASG